MSDTLFRIIGIALFGTVASWITYAVLLPFVSHRNNVLWRQGLRSGDYVKYRDHAGLERIAIVQGRIESEVYVNENGVRITLPPTACEQLSRNDWKVVRSQGI